MFFSGVAAEDRAAVLRAEQLPAVRGAAPAGAAAGAPGLQGLPGGLLSTPPPHAHNLSIKRLLASSHYTLVLFTTRSVMSKNTELQIDYICKLIIDSHKIGL